MSIFYRLTICAYQNCLMSAPKNAAVAMDRINFFMPHRIKSRSQTRSNIKHAMTHASVEYCYAELSPLMREISPFRNLAQITAEHDLGQSDLLSPL